jgi:hypothetical protein
MKYTLKLEKVVQQQPVKEKIVALGWAGIC